MRTGKIIALLSVVFIALSGSTKAQYQLVDAFPNLPQFSLPIGMLTLPGPPERVFVIEQRGRIFVFDKDSSVSSRKLFLDLSDVVSQSGGETGLLGLAFDPDYVHNGFFYVDFTSSREGRLRSYVSRFQVSPSSPDSALHSSEFVIIAQDKAYDNHNGGNILFGPDGYLYIGWGDGGSEGDPLGNGQNLTTLLGKILRIDVDTTPPGIPYSVPLSNPFFGNTYDYREEIFAYGLRNPWRMSFDPPTGKLWVGDVGQDTWEEIDTITAGGNYGWNRMEGYACYNPSSGCDSTGLIPPLWVYDHSGGNQAIIGGYVYHGSALPSLTGSYIYGDYATGRIWAFSDGRNSSSPNRLLTVVPDQISSFGVDRAGEVYVLSYQSGRIFRIAASTASIAGNPVSEPARFELFQNYPNPYNPTTTIRFTLEKAGETRLNVYDVVGHEIALVVNERLEAGEHSVIFDAEALPSGVYFYRLESGGATQQRAMIILK